MVKGIRPRRMRNHNRATPLSKSGVSSGALLRRGVHQIIVEEELRQRLESGEILRLKQGFDPTRPDLHLGHAVGLRKLRQFQELGHRVVLIVGDWTAQIGDPSGQSETRRMLSAAEVQANAATFMDQFFSVVDRQRTEIRWQSEWYGNFKLDRVIDLTRKFTVAQILQREDFATRYRESNPISVTELLYPLLQAYDSVAIRADVEFGGSDQMFNILAGRQLLEMEGYPPQQAFLVKLIVGTDSQKAMSQSRGNYIGVSAPPDDMYGMLMSLRDDVMPMYFECLTDVPEEELEELQAGMAQDRVNPRDVKMRLAREIVSQFHSPEAARLAEEEFVRVFSRREEPADIQPLTVSADAISPIDLLLQAGWARSRSEAKRLILGGSVELDHRRILDWKTPIPVTNGTALRCGPLRWRRLVSGGGGDV